MPRSSRHKSHKQQKHGSKNARQHSDSEEDERFKDRKDRDAEITRVSRDLASVDKRKLVLLSPDGTDLSDEYAASKKRKERATSDRWYSVDVGQQGSSFGDKETKEESSSRLDSEKGSRLKVPIDSKSKSSRRHESLNERKKGNAGLAVEGEEVKISVSSIRVESKRKPVKDLVQKEDRRYKVVKDKELGAERDSKARDVVCEISVDAGLVMEVACSGASRKQGSQLRASVDEHQEKREVENTEWQMQDEFRNSELKKTLEKQIKRRGDGSNNKDKRQDGVRDASNRILPTGDDRDQNVRCNDGKIKDDRHRGLYQDLDRDHRNQHEKCRADRSDTKRSRDGSNTVESRHKKSKPQSSDRDGSLCLDNQGTRYKGNRRKKRSSNNNEGNSDLKPGSKMEQSSEVEKKSSDSGKVESLADRGGSQLRHADTNSTASSSRQKSSPSSLVHFAKDRYRHSSKQAVSKYKDCVSEERVGPTSGELSGIPGVSERAAEPWSAEKPRLMIKPIQKDGNHLAELSAERPLISDAQASPMHLIERSHSSTTIDHRHLNITTGRQNLGVEEIGHKSTDSNDAMDYFTNEDRGSGELPLEKTLLNELSQADGDTPSVSSFNMTSQLPSSSTYLLQPPPPSRNGVECPSILGLSEEVGRGKFSNRFKNGDPNLGRGHGNSWKAVQNWPSPITNAFIRFQHRPSPGGFHAIMQQFPASPLFGGRPSMELNPSGGPFGWQNPGDEAYSPHLHGWERSNGIFRDESHMHRRQAWDCNGHLMGGQGWERGAEMWKGRNNGVNMELPTTSQKKDNQLAPADEVWARQPGQQPWNERSPHGSRAESIKIKRSTVIPLQNDPYEAPVQTIHGKKPEPFKTSNDSTAWFCHVYLSKLDISVDLTHPELYKQFVNLLDTEGNSTNGDNVNKHAYLEESKEAEMNISKTTLSAPLFPFIMDSALQRAMTLYKKHGEEMKAKLPSSCFPESDPMRVTTPDGVKPETVPASSWEKLEAVPTSDGEKKKLNVVLTSPRGKPEEPVPVSDKEIEDTVPISCQKVDEPVPTPDEEKPKEQVLSSSHLEEVETVMASNLEKLEIVKDPYPLHVSHSTANSPGKDKDINMASKSEGIYSGSSSEQKAFSDNMCGPLGITVGSSEACEAFMPESIKCRLVNFSRIHISPESTR